MKSEENPYPNIPPKDIQNILWSMFDYEDFDTIILGESIRDRIYNCWQVLELILKSRNKMDNLSDIIEWGSSTDIPTKADMIRMRRDVENYIKALFDKFYQEVKYELNVESWEHPDLLENRIVSFLKENI